MSQLLDTLLDRSFVGFSQIGLSVRSRLPDWPADSEPGALVDRRVAVTGATSGLGIATALGLASLGAELHLVVRNTGKATSIVARIEREHPLAVVHVHRCDVGNLDDVRRFASAWDAGPLNVVVHNAGLMPAERTESPQGHELSLAVHLLGPLLMTDLLPLAADARVVMVTSGGMLGQRLRADDPEYLDGDYSPTTAYARSKRAQVELLPRMAARWGVPVWATHPGWADTPGVVESLPTFHRVMGPLLRDAEGGADTTVWLSAVQPTPRSGGLWHDRHERPTHLLPRTRSRPGDVDRMWSWALEHSGLEER